MKKPKILFFGIGVFTVGICFYLISWHFLAEMSLCENYNGAQFLPDTTITVTCKVLGDVGQELTFRATFYPNGGTTPIQIPAHLEIKDPNDMILYDMNFDDKTIISFKPEKPGIYTATITSLEDKNNRIHQGYTDIIYALGFLTDYNDVYNPLGNAFVWMLPIGNVVFLLGIAIMIYSVINGIRKNHLHNTVKD